jgi:hypothetical protein
MLIVLQKSDPINGELVETSVNEVERSAPTITNDIPPNRDIIPPITTRIAMTVTPSGLSIF